MTSASTGWSSEATCLAALGFGALTGEIEEWCHRLRVKFLVDAPRPPGHTGTEPSLHPVFEVLVRTVHHERAPPWCWTFAAG
jgi:hypothetical protein